MKKRCAKEALRFIQDGMIVGLGGGSTIAHLVDFLKEANLNVKIVTPSFQTEQLCIEKGLCVLATHSVSSVDVAFDGCDEVDSHFHALKSGGGIHTREKIIGNMAKNYIILADEVKYAKELAFTHPVVLEVVKDAYASVVQQVVALGGSVQIRQSANKDGGILSDQGLLIVDAMFNREKVLDVKQLYEDLIHIVGILEVSLFINQVTKVLIVKEDRVDLIEK